MAITLDIVPKPGPTPIGFNTPAAQTFASDYFKLTDGGASGKNQRVLSILGLLYELAAAGGANYKTNHAGLIQDAGTYSNAISLLNKEGAMAALEWSAGRAADATLSNDLDTLLKEARDFLQKSELELDRIIIFLRAQLQR